MLDLTGLKTLSIQGINLVKLTLNGTQIWKKGYKNWVPYSINADGSIYNNGLGYKNGYRIRSGGAEGAASNASCTGYIPAKAGYVIKMSGWNAREPDAGASNAINVSDSSFTNLGQAVSNSSTGYGIFEELYPTYGWSSIVENPTGVYSWTVPPDASIAYIRVTGFTKADGSKMIVTVNEEIT